MKRRPVPEELKPISSPPSMWTLNGFGTRLYGRRDRDPETNSYVGTLYVTALFIPLFALASYRVVDAPGGGWYFVGKTRISSLAKIWNLFVVLLTVSTGGSIAWQIHLSSDGYIAGQLLTEAHELETKGELLPAAKRYSELITRGVPAAECRQARELLTAMVCERAKECSGKDQIALLRRSLRQIKEKELRGCILEAGLALVQEQRKLGNPCVAYSLLKIVAAKSKTEGAKAGLREGILHECVSSKNVGMEHVEALASILDGRGDSEGLESLLTPYADQLGSTEAARMLGMIYSKKGKLAESAALLGPYVEGRLKVFRKAEKRYESAVEKAQRISLKRLRGGTASAGWYSRYDATPKSKQQVMVDEYINSGIRKDRSVKRAMASLEQETRIVPFVMDLAITKLHLSRGKKTEAAQKTTLNEAEKLFMAVQGIAGEDESFRIFLGQVKYWLGKSDEGKALFDLALQQGGRRADLLLTVARVMRQIGQVEQARGLAEEAYSTGKKESERSSAASLRAALFRDIEDRIEWLRKVAGDAPSIRAALASAEADKALSEGDFVAAEKHYLAADRLYGAMPLDSAVLNNRALVKGQLFSLTGAAKHLEDHVSMLEKSEALNQTHTVIKSNLANGYFQRMASRAMQNEVDYRLLRSPPQYDHIALLVRTGTELRKTVAVQAGKEEIRRIEELGERLQLLAPESGDGPGALLALTYYSDDVGLCRKLVGRLRTWQAEKEEELGDEEKLRRRQQALGTNRKRFSLLHPELVKSAQASRMTKALLRCQVADLHRSAFMLGGAADAAEVLALSTQAFGIHPSLYTEIKLREAHLFAALHGLVKEDQRAAATWRRCREKMNADDVCLWLLHTDRAWRKKLLADSHFRSAAEIYRKMAEREPQEQGLQCWLVLSHTHPEMAARVAAALAKNEHDELQLEARFLLSPRSPGVVVQKIWRAQAVGNRAEAERLLAQAKEDGVPL